MVLRTSGAVPADPAQYQQLHNLVEALAIGDGIPKPAVYVINDPSPNAFATGVSPEKASITFTTGLLADMNREELEGVTGHEMSHIKNHDIRLLLIVGTMIGMAALLASILWRERILRRRRTRGRDNGNQLVIVIFAAGLLLAVVGFIFGPLIRLALSRRRESLADVSGVELTRNPAGLLSALKKLQQNDKPFKNMNHATAAMCIDDPLQHHEAWYHRLYDTHPPHRGADRRAREDRLGPVGLTGRPVDRGLSRSWRTWRTSQRAAGRRIRWRAEARRVPGRLRLGQNLGSSPGAPRGPRRRRRRTPPP